MKKFLFIIACIFFSQQVFAEEIKQIKISGHLIENTRFAHVTVNQFGLGQSTIASAPIEETKFTVFLPADISPGVYRLHFSQMGGHDYIDLIINGKETDIAFTLDVLQDKWIPGFQKSNENQKWYDFLEAQNVMLHKIDVLHIFLGNYPDEKDRIYRDAFKAFERQKKNYKAFFKKFVNQNDGTFAGKMVANSPQYFTNPTDLPQLQLYNRRINFWKDINTTNPELINTPLYTEHILNYVSYYMNPDMDFTEKEMVNGFKNSVDTIMYRFGGNEITKSFALQYLSMGFKEIGLSEVLQYIDETYHSVEQCENESERAALEKRLELYSRFSEGLPAPEIFYSDGKGLKDIAADTLVIVFWAAWCPHCLESLPLLNEISGKFENLGVLGVSLDTDPQSYMDFAKKLDNFLHYADFQGWESPVAQDYHVYATPTFFVLDEKRNFVHNFSSVTGLISWLEGE